jgi:glucan phosphoethanolaminetransferase (alkaline phosphatase superfamily)
MDPVTSTVITIPPITSTIITVPQTTTEIEYVLPFTAFLPWLVVFIFALIFAFSCMAIAKAKGYNQLTWWFIGFVLGIIGLIILACFPSKNYNRS